MKENHMKQEDEVVKKALDAINKEMELFKSLHNDTIGELIKQNRFDDLCTIMYKQGFLIGMRFANGVNK